MAPPLAPPKGWFSRLVVVLAWLALGASISAALLVSHPEWLERFSAPASTQLGVRPARVLHVSPGSALSSVSAAIEQSQPGDTIVVAPGVYTEQIRLRTGVSVISSRPLGATIRASGIAIDATRIEGASLSGFRVLSAGELQVGVRIEDSQIDLTEIEIAGARQEGLSIRGASTVSVRASRIHDNAGSGIVSTGAAPRLVRNEVFRNGRPGRPGLDLREATGAVVEGNVFWDNGAEAIRGDRSLNAAALAASNHFKESAGSTQARRQVRLIRQPDAPEQKP